MAFVELEKRRAVGVITMNRPEALNALNDQVLRDLSGVLDQVEEDPEILVAVVTGAGRSFVAGADIGQMSGFTAVEGKAYVAGEPDQAHHRGRQRFCAGGRVRAVYGLRHPTGQRKGKVWPA